MVTKNWLLFLREKETLFDQALPNITKGMEDLAGAQTKRTKLMIEADKKREELFLKHKADESQQTCENIKPKKPVKIESMS